MRDFQGVRAAGKPPDFSGRLRELGHVDGEGIAIRFLAAGGEVDRLPKLAEDLVDDGRQLDELKKPTANVEAIRMGLDLSRRIEEQLAASICVASDDRRLTPVDPRGPKGR